MILDWECERRNLRMHVSPPHGRVSVQSAGHCSAVITEETAEVFDRDAGYCRAGGLAGRTVVDPAPDGLPRTRAWADVSAPATGGCAAAFTGPCQWCHRKSHPSATTT